MSVVIAVRWSASLDGLVCGYCVAMHGTLFEVGYEMVTHPNCFVGDTVVSGSRALASSTRWYTGEVVDIETIDGNRFTVTPNHPILTTKGWVSAGLLNESHYVIRCLDSEGMHRFINPNDYQIPSTIKEVAESLSTSLEVRSVTVPVTPKDFHYDGAGSNVAIISTDGYLGDYLKPSFFEHSHGGYFMYGGGQLAGLPSERALAKFIDTWYTSPHRAVSGSDVPPVLFWCPFEHHKAISVNLTPQSDFLGNQPSAYRLPVNSKPLGEDVLRDPRLIEAGDFIIGQTLLGAASTSHFRSPYFEGGRTTTPEFALYESILECSVSDMVTPSDFLARLAGHIVPDRVLNVNRRTFSGHVYNLQTSTGFYVANNIIAHNCRCALAPVTQSWADLGIGDDDGEPMQTGEEWLREQDQETQERILGKAGRAAWLDGQFELKDMIGVKEDDLLGEIGYRKSLIEILGEELADYYKRRVA